MLTFLIKKAPKNTAPILNTPVLDNTVYTMTSLGYFKCSSRIISLSSSLLPKVFLTVSGIVKAYLTNSVYMFEKKRVNKPAFH